MLLFHVYFHRCGNCKHFVLCIVLSFSIDSISPCFLSTLTSFPLRVVTGTPVSIPSFLGLKVPGSDLLIHASLYHGLQLLGSSVLNYVVQF